MNQLVLDCSFTMKWCFADEVGKETEAVLERLLTDRNVHAIVPALWRWEVTNVLLIGERRGRLTFEQANIFSNLLSELPISIQAVPSWEEFHSIRTLARTHGLTVYDATYLELALRHNIPLASRDVELRKATQTHGIALL